LELNIMNLKKIRYNMKKNAKVPNFIINKTCHMGHFTFLMGHEKTYRNLINLDIR
jgi:hypothetical protein